MIVLVFRNNTLASVWGINWRQQAGWRKTSWDNKLLEPELGQSKEISAIKKEYIWISSNEVDETGAYYTEWSKPERKTPI